MQCKNSWGWAGVWMQTRARSDLGRWLRREIKQFVNFHTLRVDSGGKFYHLSISTGKVLPCAVFFGQWMRWELTTYIHTSMTSLLAHRVAQPTKWKFLPKNLSQLVIFVIELVFTWSWVNKNHQNLIFKVNFLCQKSVL